MNPYKYQSCDLPDHDAEYLNMVCIDEKCNKRQMLCCYCQSEHQKCKTIPLRKFTKQFQDQLNQLTQETSKVKYTDLILYFDQIEATLEQSQKLINEIFNKTKSAIHDAKNSIQQMTTSDAQPQSQGCILQKFESEPSKENFCKLLIEIESFKPNSDKYSFTLKKNASKQLPQSTESVANGKIYAQQYQSAANTFTEQFLNLHEVLKRNITNFFTSAPTRVTEPDNDGKRFDKFKSDNIFTQVSHPNQQQQQQPKSIISIEDDIDPPKPNKEQKPSQKKKQNDVVSLPSEEDGCTLSQFKQYLDKSTANKKEQGNKQNTNPIPQQKQQQQEVIQPKQPEIPNNKALSQDDNIGEGETILNVQESKEFQFMFEGQEITKLIYLNKNLIGGIGGTKCMIFDVSPKDQERPIRIQTLQYDVEFTDIAYLEMDEENGQLYLATKKGNMLTYIKEGVKNISFRQTYSSTHSLDKPGNLFLQVSAVDKCLYSVGDEKTIKIWSMKTMKELKRVAIQDLPTAFHLDYKIAFVGGSNFIQIWEPTTGVVTHMKGLDSKVTKILTNDQKMFVSMMLKIKIYDKVGLGEYHLSKEVTFGQIFSMQLLKTWPMLVISYMEKSVGKVSLYNYVDELQPETLVDRLALSCAVKEQERVNYLAFGLSNGICLIYKMEQTFQQSQ
ncbi:unnamed protein product (macronuclear) [Paramecium tetraurelia]|uniref:Uncharacterized protein n=1 Tax=Paramecium tetraurelia TaxID=5888 RepID=A0BGX3_PARTE|nr:uncharacterized protein GSPATT00028825001 [Paramecium tetraurelia]CAK57790.1 unnamed protein product [Paramecium tetraurelia]|eukprot:XP_001425188.1 hypothetical protein (macronuclear) [Paramecium tetraurelia strain d4-2]